MGVQVMGRPEKKGISLGTIGTVAGGVAGAVVGGPAGIMTGASIGGTAGGLAQQANQSAPPAQLSAMERRHQQMQSDPMMQIADARAALPELSPEVRAAAEEPINRAYEMAMKRQKGPYV